MIASAVAKAVEEVEEEEEGGEDRASMVVASPAFGKIFISARLFRGRRIILTGRRFRWDGVILVVGFCR